MEPDSAPVPARIDWPRSFYFFVNDRRWAIKLLVGGLFAMLSAVGVGMVFVVGYLLRLLRSVIRGQDQVLPDWNDWRRLVIDGIVGVCVYLTSMLVPLLPAVVAAVTLGVLERHLGLSDTDWVALVGALSLVGLSLFVTLVLWMVLLYLPSAFVRVALTGRFMDGFAFRANIGFIRRNAAGYLIALLVYLGASTLAAVGYLLCCVGVFLTGFWAFVVYVWALGQVARRDAETRRLSTV